MPNFNNTDFFIVTGASSGIGEAVALTLNAKGATVVGIARNAAALDTVRNKAAFPEKFFCEQKDLAQDVAALPEFMNMLKDKYGKFKGVACCAGITETRPLRALDVDAMKQLFEINYFAPVMMAKGFADKRVNIGAGSSFVSISSCAYDRPAKAIISYSGSKAALVASMVAIAKEFAPKGIRFNTVSPSDIDTPMTQRIPEIMDKVRQFYPMGFGEPQDVANVVVFLLSDKAKWITGQNYVVDCASR